MTELEFTAAYLGEYRQRGAEIQTKQCPFCHGGEHGDTYTFALNTENHVYKCLRGSCGAQGHFSELCKEKGVRYLDEEVTVHTPKVTKNYRKPEPVEVTDGGMDYIQSRKITPETARAFGVGGNHQGEIVFPFYETAQDFESGLPTFIKYRPAHKLKKGESKARREKGTKPILFGMHLCNPDQKRLTIFEGEFDAMAGYQAGGINCVSVPSGCQDFTWLDTCHDWLKQFEAATIIADNDAPGRKMLQELSAKLECIVLEPDFTLYDGCKDANEILFKHGAEALGQIICTARPVPVLGLLDIADVQPMDVKSIPRVMSGIAELDRMTGGQFQGDLNIWTGKRGEGKSTLCTQILLEAIEQGTNVCAYSGEIPADRFKYGVCLQAAGNSWVEDFVDQQAGRVTQYVKQEKLAVINEWLRSRFWLYDNRIVEEDESKSILRVFEQAYRRYDCRVFLVDNLTIVRSCERETDVYQTQANFTIALRKFAEKTSSTVHLVIHPRKVKGDVRDNDDVGGLGLLTNVACNVYSLKRVAEEEHYQLQCDAVLTCMKNRMYGEMGDIRLNYHPRSRRLVEVGKTEKLFSWAESDLPPF